MLYDFIQSESFGERLDVIKHIGREDLNIKDPRGHVFWDATTCINGRGHILGLVCLSFVLLMLKYWNIELWTWSLHEFYLHTYQESKIKVTIFFFQPGVRKWGQSQTFKGQGHRFNHKVNVIGQGHGTISMFLFGCSYCYVNNIARLYNSFDLFYHCHPHNKCNCMIAKEFHKYNLNLCRCNIDYLWIKCNWFWTQRLWFEHRLELYELVSSKHSSWHLLYHKRW